MSDMVVVSRKELDKYLAMVGRPDIKLVTPIPLKDVCERCVARRKAKMGTEVFHSKFDSLLVAARIAKGRVDVVTDDRTHHLEDYVRRHLKRIVADLDEAIEDVKTP